MLNDRDLPSSGESAHVISMGKGRKPGVDAKRATVHGVDLTLSARLRAWREFKGMELGPAAKALGYVQGWLSQVETGKTRLMPQVLLKMAEVYDVPAWDLVNRDPYEPTEEEKALRLIRQLDHDLMKQVGRLDKERLRQALSIAEIMEAAKKH